MSETQKRIVKRVTGYGYEEIDFMDLKKGDLFTLTEPDGTLIEYNGNYILDAIGDPYINKDGVPEIFMKDYRPLTLH